MRGLSPPFPRSHGVPRVDDRRRLSGIIYVIRHRPQWRDAPAAYGPHKILYNRFLRWSGLGVFDRVFAALAAEAGPPDRLTELQAPRRLRRPRPPGPDVASSAARARTDRASGLALFTAAIALWNTVYPGRALDALRRLGAVVPDALLGHLARSDGNTPTAPVTTSGGGQGAGLGPDGLRPLRGGRHALAEAEQPTDGVINADEADDRRKRQPNESRPPSRILTNTLTP
jgi:transposase